MRKLLTTLIAACLASVMAEGKAFSIDLRASATRARVSNSRLSASSSANSDGTIRTLNLGAGAADVGEVAVGDELSFSLFDDVAITLTLKSKMPSPLGGDVFLAEASGYEGVKNAVVLRNEDGLTVDMRDYRNKRLYKVFSTATGVRVEEIEPRAGRCGCDALEPLATSLSASPQGAVANGSARLLSSSPSTFVDILVAYEKGASNWVKGRGGVTNFAVLAVQHMNAVLANTEIDKFFRFRLVGVVCVESAASDLNLALDRATYGRDGWEKIRIARDEVGADIVSVLVDTDDMSGATGLGWSLRSESFDSFAENAYNACDVRAVSQTSTMAHECGHNMGAGHSDVQETQPGPQLYTYSAGYYFNAGETSYATVMAYGSENPDGKDSVDIPYFSSPNHSYLGEPIGDASHDNTRTILQTYAAVAAFRATKAAEIDGTDGNLPTIPSKVSATGNDANGTIAIAYAAASRAGSYEIWRGTKWNPAESVRIASDVVGEAYVDTSASPDVLYYYRVKAVNSFGEGELSAPATGCWRNGGASGDAAIGNALGAPHLDWTTEGAYPWTIQESDTYDGVGALQSAFTEPSESGVVSVLKTTVTGPTRMSFRYKTRMYASWFVVKVDDDEAFLETREVGGWTLAEVAIPEGDHEIVFSYTKGGYYTAGFNGVYLDMVRFDELSVPPTLTPATTDDEYTAKTFAGSLKISIAAPEGSDVFYTTDGSEPTRQSARYDGPFTISATTRVKATCVQNGYDCSAVTSGLYLERHSVQAGEWTTDVEGAKKAALKNGSLIVTLMGDYETCSYTRAFAAVSESAAFLSWAKANGVYLITADSSRWPDTDAAADRFWDLHNKAGQGNWVAYPSLAIANAWDPDGVAGYVLARPGQGEYIGNVLYDGTVLSLENGLGSFFSTRPSGTYVWVEFDGNGGTVYTRSMVGMAGQAITGLPYPDRDYYDFDGWYTSAIGGTEVTEGTVLSGDAVFYAHWTPARYIVQFDANGGLVSTSFKLVDYGMAYGDLPTPSRTGTDDTYTFDGWYTAAIGGVKITPETVVKQTADQTLYAHWNSRKHVVTLNANGGSVSGQASVSVQVEIGKPTNQAAGNRTVSRTGYTLVGWYDTRATTGGNLVFDARGYAADGKYWDGSYAPSVSSAKWKHVEDVVAYARWVPNKNMVRLNANGGSVSGQEFVSVQVEIGKNTSQAAANRTVLRDGCTLVGWYDTRATTGGNLVFDARGYAADGAYWDGSYSPGVSSAMWKYAGGVTAYARWAQNKSTVTLNANGGSVSGQQSITAQVEYGKNTNQAAGNRAVSRTGYTLAGWYDTNASSGGNMVFDARGYAADGVYWDGSYSPGVSSAKWKYVGGVIAYARWVKSKSTVTFYGGGKTLGTAAMEYGKNTYQAAASAYKPTRAGYVLTGWYDKDGKILFDAQGRAANGDYWNGSYSPGVSSATWKYAGNVTAYANWAPATGKYTVTFYGGGKTLGTATVEMGKNTYQAAASAYKPTRAGYVLTGWYDANGKILFDAQGRAANGDYWNGSYIKGSSSATWKYAGNVTAYANWTPATGKYTVTFYGGGKTLGTATVETGKNTNQAAASLYKPTRAGYVLTGWYDANGKILFDAQGRAVNGDYWNGSYVKGSSSATWKYAGNVTAYAYWAANTNGRAGDRNGCAVAKTSFGPGLLAGTFEDGSLFLLMLDEGLRTACLSAWPDDGGTRECEAMVVDDTLVLTTKDGEAYRLAWEDGNLIATRAE